MNSLDFLIIYETIGVIFILEILSYELRHRVIEEIIKDEDMDLLMAVIFAWPLVAIIKIYITVIDG